MTPNTILKQSLETPSAYTTFSADNFNAYVMNTYGRFPIALERGEGCRVWDTEGKKYLDFVAGIATCTLGHAHPVMMATVSDQIQRLHHVSNLYYIPVQGELAKWLIQHSCADKAFFCNSGAEANEGAIKLARKYAHEKLNIENPIIWGYENLGIEPDIFTSAKGLGGGIPIGAMLCKSHCDVLEPGSHASTFGGNPFACAVGLAVCQTLEQENLLANVKQRGEELRIGLNTIAAKYPNLFTEVRGWGLINGMELNADLEVTSIDIVKAAMNEGLLILPAGPKVLRFVPPLIVTNTEVMEAMDGLIRAIVNIVK